MSEFAVWCGKAKAWLCSDENKQRAQEMKVQVKKAFCDHPAEIGESYFVHWCSSMKMTARLAYATVALFIHGMFPFLFTRTASSQMREIYAIMFSRLMSDEEQKETADHWQV